MSIADIPQLQNLTDAETIDLIDELWARISPPPSDDQDLARLLEERIAHAEAHPSSMLSLDEFKRRLHAADHL